MGPKYGTRKPMGSHLNLCCDVCHPPLGSSSLEVLQQVVDALFFEPGVLHASKEEKFLRPG